MRHDLLDAGWRVRMLARHALVFAPLCALFGLLPGSWLLRGTVAGLVFGSSVFTVAVYADELRAARLRQHRLPAPGDHDDGPSGGLPTSPWHR